MTAHSDDFNRTADSAGWTDGGALHIQSNPARIRLQTDHYAISVVCGCGAVWLPDLDMCAHYPSNWPRPIVYQVHDSSVVDNFQAGPVATKHAWHNFDDELPPPRTAIEVVRYVHTSAEWPPMCHRVVSTAWGSIPAAPYIVDLRFEDLPPRAHGERSTWWRLTDEWVSNGEGELIWIPTSGKRSC